MAKVEKENKAVWSVGRIVDTLEKYKTKHFLESIQQTKDAILITIRYTSNEKQSETFTTITIYKDNHLKGE